MASRNQYTYTPGYGGANRQSQARNAAFSGAGPRPARRPAAPPAAQRPMGDTIILTLLFIVAPLCGILGIFFQMFLWFFIGVTALVLVAMWALRCFEPRGRAFLSGVLAVLTVFALIAVVDLSPREGYFPSYGGDPVTTADSGGGQNPNIGNGAGFAGLAAASPTPTPPIGNQGEGENAGGGDSQGGQNAGLAGLAPEVTASPGGTDAPMPFVSDAQVVLDNYLRMWADKNYEDMVQYTTPAWRAAQTMPNRQLSWNHSSWTLNSWQINGETQSATADSATMTVIADLTKTTSDKTQLKRQYTAIVFNVDGTWYVDPDSMRSGITVTEDPVADPAAQGASASTPSPTTSPSLKLWYNSDGGQYYHVQERCSSIAEKNYKYMKSFTYGEVNDKAYSKLLPCGTCNAPKR